MAANKYSLVDIQDEDHEIDLQFQDFGTTATDFALPESSSSNNPTYFPNFRDQQDDTEKLLGEDEAVEETTKTVHSFWTFEYYQQFFNVESKQVGDRILWSMIPKPGVNYLQTYIRPNPDLYGPFWICVTLIFTTAITGNLANYLQSPDNYKWKYDFHKVTLATTSIFCYAWFVPILIWSLLYWRGSRASMTLLDLICLYGYSLAVFVPVSLLWMVPLKWLQWCLGIVGSVLSGGVLVRTIVPALSHESKRTVMAIATVILLLHASLALGFMLYFFYPPTPTSALDKVIEAPNITDKMTANDTQKLVGAISKDLERNAAKIAINNNLNEEKKKSEAQNVRIKKSKEKDGTINVMENNKVNTIVKEKTKDIEPNETMKKNGIDTKPDLEINADTKPDVKVNADTKSKEAINTEIIRNEAINNVNDTKKKDGTVTTKPKREINSAFVIGIDS